MIGNRFVTRIIIALSSICYVLDDRGADDRFICRTFWTVDGGALAD
jgi:hypothetical protein